MPAESHTHLVLIPSYNTGPRLFETVERALAVWQPVWVVIDGSTDGTGRALAAWQRQGLRVLNIDQNSGKGGALLHGLRAALAEGFTHALTMDADGQHDPSAIPEMMHRSQSQPSAMILGVPIFDSSAPGLRVAGRRVSNNLADIVTLWAGIGDSLFGLRVYPIAPLLRAFSTTRWMRRFDFDPEAAVRLCWQGVVPVNVPSAVRYYAPSDGGVSHFKYGRDNALLGFMYLRLFAGFAWRWPILLARRLRSSRH